MCRLARSRQPFIDDLVAHGFSRGGANSGARFVFPTSKEAGHPAEDNGPHRPGLRYYRAAATA